MHKIYCLASPCKAVQTGLRRSVPPPGIYVHGSKGFTKNQIPYASRYHRSAETNACAKQVLPASDEPSFVHIMQELPLRKAIFPSTTTFIHVIASTHPEKWFLYVESLHTVLEHANPEVVVL